MDSAKGPYPPFGCLSVRRSSRSADSVSRSADSVSRSADSVSRSADSVSRSADSVSRSADSVSRSADSVSRSADSVSRSAEVPPRLSHGYAFIKYPSSGPDILYSLNNLASTRRFRARPSSVALSSIGSPAPYPRATTRSPAMPCPTRYDRTDSARCPDSRRL